jgi:hypothetical protein
VLVNVSSVVAEMAQPHTSDCSTAEAVEPMAPDSDPRALVRAIAPVARRPRREVVVGAGLLVAGPRVVRRLLR